MKKYFIPDSHGGTKFYKTQGNIPLTEAQRTQSQQRRDIWARHKVLQGTREYASHKGTKDTKPTKKRYPGLDTKFYKAQGNMHLTKAQRTQSQQRRGIWVRHRVLQGTRKYASHKGTKNTGPTKKRYLG